MKKEPKEYTLTDLIAARDEESNRIRIILEYLLNKNSQSIAEGGVNYEEFFYDIQDLERELTL